MLFFRLLVSITTIIIIIIMLILNNKRCVNYFLLSLVYVKVLSGWRLAGHMSRCDNCFLLLILLMRIIIVSDLIFFRLLLVFH